MNYLKNLIFPDLKEHSESEEPKEQEIVPKIKKYIWLVKFKYHGYEHTDGYCSGNDGDTEKNGIVYRYLKYPHPNLQDREDLVYKLSELEDLTYTEKWCSADGSGYCSPNVKFKAEWAKKVETHSDKKVLIKQCSEEYDKLMSVYDTSYYDYFYDDE